MSSVTKKLWNDDAGFIISVELILIATISVIGLLAGLTAVRDGVVCELSDVAGAVQDLNQSYSYSALTGHSATNVGSDFLDSLDFCDNADQVAGQADNGITFTVGPRNEGTGIVTPPTP